METALIYVRAKFQQQTCRLTGFYLLSRRLQSLEEIIVGLRRRFANVQNELGVSAFDERFERNIAGFGCVVLILSQKFEEAVPLLQTVPPRAENFGRLQDLVMRNLHDVVHVIESLKQPMAICGLRKFQLHSKNNASRRPPFIQKFGFASSSALVSFLSNPISSFIVNVDSRICAML